MGSMLANPSITTQIRPRAHFIPTVVVFAVDGLSILSSIYSTKSTVKIWDLVDPKMDGAPHLFQSVESNRRFAHYCMWLKTKLKRRELPCEQPKQRRMVLPYYFPTVAFCIELLTNKSLHVILTDVKINVTSRTCRSVYREFSKI